jgi:HSP20 family protein
MASNLTRYDPFRDLLRGDPFRNVEEFMRAFPMSAALRGVDSEHSIRVDVDETEQAYLVKADMPGLKKDDIKVSVDGHHVSISATLQEEKEQAAGGSVYRERYSGSQYRSFSLPQEVDDAKTEARYQDGVLHLTLPKKGGTAHKQIPVQ